MPAFFEIFMAMIGAMMSGASVLAQDSANNQNIALAKETLNRQQKFSEESADAAQQRQIDLYTRFFSPEAITKQYKEAGLNPALIYAKGGVGGSSMSAPMATTPATAVPYVNPLLGQGQMAEMMNVVKTLTEAQKTKAETEKTEEEIKNLAKVREQIDQAIKESNAQIRLIEKKCDTEVASKTLMETQNRIAEIDEQWKTADWSTRIRLYEQQIELLNKQWDKLEQEISGLQIDNANKQKMYDATLRNLYAQTAKSIADTHLAYAQTEVEKAKKYLVEKQTELTETQKTEINTKIKEMEANIKKVEKECDVLSDEHTDNWWKFRSYKALGYNQTNHGASGLLGPLVEGAKGLGEMLGDLFN